MKKLPVMEDYLRLHYVGDPCAKNGRVAWMTSWWDTSAPVGFRRFREEVRLAEVQGNQLQNERRVTAGGRVERHPAIAGDGAVYFLSDASLGAPMPEDGTMPKWVENELYSQLQLYRWQDGQVEQLTAMRHGVNRFFIAPDEKKIFFLAWKYQTDDMADLTREYTEEERAAALAERLSVPFVTERQRYKADAEMGYRSVRSELLWLWEDGHVRCLLDEDADFAAPCWLPDSETILFQRTNEDGKLAFCTLAIRDGAVNTLATVENVSMCFEDDYAPVIDVARGQIIFGANTPGMQYADPRRVYAIPLAGGENLTARALLSPEKDVDGVFSQDMNFPTRSFNEAEYLLMPDGNFYYTTGFEGDVHIARVPAGAEDAAPEMVTGAMVNFHALCAFDENRILALCAYPDRIAELGLIDIRTGGVKLLTDANPWLHEVALQIPESVWTASGTHGFYLPPIGGERPAPVILYCHGGPTGFYCSGMNYELQALAAAGFGVLYANPRGGTGYGRERNKDEFAYDGSALADLLEFVDTVCEKHPELDAKRLGVCGGSYGGFMTLHAASRCDRFKAASAHRALANMQMISMSSHSAGGHTREAFEHFIDWIVDGVKSSPASYVDKIRIPLQILQSECDANCVSEQANQVYTAMRTWNPDVPCEYILYPDSCHGLGHRGPVELAVHHRNANLEWFRKYL